MSAIPFDPHTIDIVGGRICLDFINTRANHLQADAREYLAGYGELVRWANEGVAAIDARTAKRLQAVANEDPAGARRAFRNAMALRELLHHVFEAVAVSGTPKPASLTALNEALWPALAHRQLRRNANGIDWAWIDTDDFSRVLWPVLLSAAEVLTHDDPARLKRCPVDEGCGWLYYDDSKNGSRRWCSMRTCGNAAKVRAHYARQRTRKNV